MANRKRKFVLRVPVTPEERVLIQQKMAQLGTKNFSAYARKMLIDGYIVHIDTGPIRAQTAELQKIGVNINQIARRINSTGTVYAQDLEDIKGALAQIWQLQRSILSSQSTGTVYAQDLEDIKGALAQIWQLQRSILSSQR